MTRALMALLRFVKTGEWPFPELVDPLEYIP